VGAAHRRRPRLDAVDPLEANFKLLTDLVLAAEVK
jgi:hypothetical protein